MLLFSSRDIAGQVTSSPDLRSSVPRNRAQRQLMIGLVCGFRDSDLVEAFFSSPSVRPERQTARDNSIDSVRQLLKQ